MKEIGFTKDGNRYLSNVISIDSDGDKVLRIEVAGNSNVRLERSITGENWVDCGNIMYGSQVFEQNIIGAKTGQKLRLVFPLEAGDDKNNIPEKIYIL